MGPGPPLFSPWILKVWLVPCSNPVYVYMHPVSHSTPSAITALSSPFPSWATMCHWAAGSESSSTTCFHRNTASVLDIRSTSTPCGFEGGPGTHLGWNSGPGVALGCQEPSLVHTRLHGVMPAHPRIKNPSSQVRTHSESLQAPLVHATEEKAGTSTVWLSHLSPPGTHTHPSWLQEPSGG